MTPSEIARFLATAARVAPSADNSQPLNFSWDGHRFSISFSPERGEGKLFGPFSHTTLLAVGACVENVNLALASLNLAGSWRFFDATRGEPNCVYAQLTFERDVNPAKPSSAHPLFDRHTNRFSYLPTTIPASMLSTIGSQTQRSARVVSLVGEVEKNALADCARLASEARFCTRELHDWLADCLRFTHAEIDSGEGLDVHTLDLPPGGSLFMRLMADWRRMTILNRFGIYKILARIETRLLRSAPALLCIVGPMEPIDVISAGRLLANLWVRLNAAGIAVHPYYVITDQLLRLKANSVPAGMIDRIRTLRTAIPTHLRFRPHESLHMILRIGFPKTSAPRSRRLALDTIYSDEVG